MVTINCTYGSYTAGAKGCKLLLKLEIDQAKKLEQVLANFRDKPLVIDIAVDAKGRMEQLARIDDGQRSYIYALFKDISESTGYGLDETKEMFKAAYCQSKEIEPFSLSDCSNELAADFMHFIAEFCLDHGIELQEPPNKRLNDLERYQVACIKNRACCVCGKQNSDIHHYDAIGIKYQRGKAEDEATLRKMCLCRTHHTEAHNIGRETFCEKYHVEPVLYNG